MTDDFLLKTRQIGVRYTFIDDLDVILKMERDKENSPFIRQWNRRQHRAAVTSKNIAHLTLQKLSDDRVIGYIIMVGLEDYDKNIEFKRLVIAEKGQGLGRQAVQLIKRLAFEKYGAHRLWLEVIFHNERAYQLYKSEGFIDEGIHRESLRRDRKFVSMRVMSLLSHEYFIKKVQP